MLKNHISFDRIIRFLKYSLFEMVDKYFFGTQKFGSDRSRHLRGDARTHTHTHTHTHIYFVFYISRFEVIKKLNKSAIPSLLPQRRYCKSGIDYKYEGIFFGIQYMETRGGENFGMITFVVGGGGVGV